MYSFMCWTKCMRSWDAKCGQSMLYEKPNTFISHNNKKPSHESHLGCPPCLARIKSHQPNPKITFFTTILQPQPHHDTHNLGCQLILLNKMLESKPIWGILEINGSTLLTHCHAWLNVIFYVNSYFLHSCYNGHLWNLLTLYLLTFDESLKFIYDPCFCRNMKYMWVKIYIICDSITMNLN